MEFTSMLVQISFDRFWYSVMSALLAAAMVVSSDTEDK